MTWQKIMWCLVAVIVACSLFFAGWYWRGRAVGKQIAELSAEIVKSDKAAAELKDILTELQASRATQEEVVRDAKNEAVASVDAISNDHDAVADRWNALLREFRGEVECD